MVDITVTAKNRSSHSYLLRDVCNVQFTRALLPIVRIPVHPPMIRQNDILLRQIL